jgi:hypothetical protein
MPVLIAAGVIGLVTLIAVVIMWRSGSRVAARMIAGSPILSVRLALPAFFSSAVPAPLVVLVAVLIVVNRDQPCPGAVAAKRALTTAPDRSLACLAMHRV